MQSNAGCRRLVREQAAQAGQNLGRGAHRQAHGQAEDQREGRHDEEAAADRVHKALETVYSERKTLTRDVGGTAGTSQFADAVLAAMG